MLSKYEHVIWDWNGTLFDDTKLSLDIINGILVRRKLKTLTLERYREIFTFPVHEYYKKAGLDFNKYSFEILGNEWINEYEKRKYEAYLHTGVREILDYISQNLKGQSILSAYSQNTLVEIIKYFKLEEYFSYLVGLDHIYATSKIEIGKKLLIELRSKPNKVVLIGDTVHDYEVAKEIGIDCILIAKGHQSKEKLLDCKVNVFDSLKNLNEFI